MNDYRIIKRKNKIHNCEEFVIQVKNPYRNIAQQVYTNTLEEKDMWSQYQVFATLWEAADRLKLIKYGLNPGEEIVG